MRTITAKLMPGLLCLMLLVQLLLPGGVMAASQPDQSIQAAASDKITWGPVNTVTYSPLYPFILLWSEPLSEGGINLTTKQIMDNPEESDLVINVYHDIGAHGIIELKEGLQDPTPRNLPWTGADGAKQGGVYLLSLHDGSLAKIRIDTLLPNKAMISYVFEAAKTVTKLSASHKEVSLKPGSTASVRVTATYSDKSFEDVTSKVQWSSEDPEIASVSNGIITGINEGETAITAELGGLTATVQVNVSEDNAGEIERLEASETEIILKPNESMSFQVYAIYADGSEQDITFDDNTTYRSTSASTATVKPGLIKAGKKTGKADIIISHGGKQLKLKVNVTKTSVKSLSPSTRMVTLQVDDTKQVRLMAEFSDGKIQDVTSQATWTTDDSTVAEVERGEIKAIEEGTAEITAKYGGKSVKITVDVLGELELIGLETSTKNLKMTPDMEKELKVWAVYDGNMKEEVTEFVEWQTEDSDVADVVDGVITAYGVGKTMIVANYEGESITISVEVVAQLKVKSLSVNKKKVTLTAGQTEKIVLKATYEDKTTEEVTDFATWTTKRDTIADVEGGLITAVGKGTTTITAKYGNKTATVSVKVN